ncbi:hypothetical protein CFE70_008781 [Pyrenophora teres f. teres 0-1]
MFLIMMSLQTPGHASGFIKSFKPYVEEELPTAYNGKNNERNREDAPPDVPLLIGAHARYRQEEICRYSEKLKIKRPWPVVKFQKGVIRTIYPDCAITIIRDPDKSFNVLSRTQIPLIAGWALTIHRSQGMTLGPYQVDLTNAFEASQVYVALSRARSLDSLEFVVLPKRIHKYGNPEVIKFMREKLGYRYP